MSNFEIYTLESAPEKSKPALETLQQAFGFIPDIAGAMAGSPTLINGFISVFQNAHSGSFTEDQIQTLLLTNAVTNASSWPVAFHTFLALKEGLDPADVEAIRAGRAPKNVQHAALSGLAKSFIEHRGHASAQALHDFLDAGFNEEQVLELINVVAASTITMMVMDRYWNVFMANESSLQFFNGFIDMKTREGPRNILHLMFDPAGMRPFIVGWERVAKSFLQRVLRESVGRVINDETKALLAELLAYPEVETEWQKPAIGMDTNDSLPVIPLSFAKDDLVLNYFSMVSTVGTPQTIAAQELRVECLFPADDLTERHHALLMAQARKPADSN